MPARGIFSTGLPNRQPAARPYQAPAIRSASAAGAGRAAGATGAISSTNWSHWSGSAGSAGAGLASTWSISSEASVRRAGLAGGSEAPERGARSLPPAANQRRLASATSLPSS
ncbi:MAG: hypothetical protein LBK54_03495 [Propionibacteriaceae bacterium]|nr:hypothetical protein [Propionibacteriaceae bacterium]